MSTFQVLVTIIAAAAATFLTRTLPLLLFPSGRETPKYISYLGKVLPCATISMLIVYCLKTVTPLAWPYGIPELLSIAAVALLQIKTRNILISIAIGLTLYMVLIRTVFAV